MVVRTGVDIIELERVNKLIARHGKRYLERIYTPSEVALCEGRVEVLAGRFAAKEAVAKALGCGIGQVGWKDIEVLSDEQNAPVLYLHGAAKQRAKELGLSNWSVSISHSHEYAVSMAVAIG